MISSDTQSPLFNAALLRWFQELSDQGLFITDADLRIRGWNRWLETHSGLHASDVAGRELFALYPHLQTEGLDRHYRDALEGRVHVLSHVLHGSLLPFGEMRQTARIAPLIDADRVIGTVTVIEDVTERAARELELRRQIEESNAARATAEAAVRAKDQFLATLSHELRNPVNAVLGWARLLSQGSGNLSHGMEVVERNALALGRLIDDLLDVARIVAGKLRLELVSTRVATVVEAAVETMRPAAQAKGIAVTIDSTAEGTVLGDPVRLQQVVLNILQNAVKFTPEGGRIGIRVERDAEAVNLTVTDTGCGIPPDLLPHIFDRFRQADQATTRRFGGLGLGLSLVKELVELHGGRVRAESDGPGHGATFIISLPAAAEEGETAPAAPEILGDEVLRARLLGLNVLLVDDDPDACERSATVLRNWGAQVITAGSIAAALGALAEVIPDVVVASLGLPGEGGYTLVRRLRSLSDAHAGIPAIALTGRAGVESRSEALHAGYHVHLPTPASPHELIAVIASVVRQPRP
jgi:PAS domain S-box-containing protein